MEEKRVLAMYDIRGIQNYIYRTAKVQDAIGASAIVECIIQESLEKAIGACQQQLTAQMEWCDADGPLSYSESEKDIVVLYIGGGNALVLYRDRAVADQINRFMSKYVLEHTYSLQLAVAMVEKSDKYSDDYKAIFDEMIAVKARMNEAQPIGALPVEQVEIKTGLPIMMDVPKEYRDYGSMSKETFLKKQKEKEVRDMTKRAKLFDTYIEGKGVDSTLAIVHIDGNNMGLRIRELIQGKDTYEDAVNTMRRISFCINDSYKKTYLEMEQFFNDRIPDSVLKILTAGDDITYVCKGKIALATVEYFCDSIGQKSMADGNDEKYGFSVCAGVAYIGSHFPFSVGYEVAESCCDSAKDRAKQTNNMKALADGTYKIGNWVDFQFCKNIYASDLDAMREREYVTHSGENLLIRPYELSLLNLEERKQALDQFEDLKKNLTFFTKKETDKLARSHAKTIRNTYSLGKSSMKELAAFLNSRNYRMPGQKEEETVEMYSPDNKALWYDALELMDCYMSLEEVKQLAGKGEQTDESL